MMACSLAWSTSVTKSLICFCEMRTDSTSSAARLMMAPAARAALMATLSMGCRLDDIDCAGLRASIACGGGAGPGTGKPLPGDAGSDNKGPILPAQPLGAQRHLQAAHENPFHPHPDQPCRQRGRCRPRHEDHGL